MLAAIGAATLTGVELAEVEVIAVPHRKAPLLDNVGVELDMDTLNASARNAAGAIIEQTEAFDLVTERCVGFSQRLDAIDDGGGGALPECSSTWKVGEPIYWV